MLKKLVDVELGLVSEIVHMYRLIVFGCVMNMGLDRNGGDHVPTIRSHRCYAFFNQF